jgi:hypothetical protein
LLELILEITVPQIAVERKKQENNAMGKVERKEKKTL